MADGFDRGSTIESSSVDFTSEFTTWSEATEFSDVLSEAERWREIRERIEPILIVAKMTTPFINQEEERNFHKAVLLFVNSLRIKENPEDLLHVATVCTDTDNPVTRNYLGKGEIHYVVHSRRSIWDRVIDSVQYTLEEGMVSDVHVYNVQGCMLSHFTSQSIVQRTTFFFACLGSDK